MVICMIFGTLASLSLFPVFAADTADNNGGEKETIDYLNDAFKSKEDKLASMTLMLKRYGYELYYEPYTGEVGARTDFFVPYSALDHARQLEQALMDSSFEQPE